MIHGDTGVGYIDTWEYRSRIHVTWGYRSRIHKYTWIHLVFIRYIE